MKTSEIKVERVNYLESYLKMTEEEGLYRFRLGEFRDTPVQAVLEKYAYLLGEDDARL
jgi:hypothetical protein